MNSDIYLQQLLNIQNQQYNNILKCRSQYYNIIVYLHLKNLNYDVIQKILNNLNTIDTFAKDIYTIISDILYQPIYNIYYKTEFLYNLEKWLMVNVVLINNNKTISNKFIVKNIHQKKYLLNLIFKIRLWFNLVTEKKLYYNYVEFDNYILPSINTYDLYKIY
jgi:hypothetical protein